MTRRSGRCLVRCSSIASIGWSRRIGWIGWIAVVGLACSDPEPPADVLTPTPRASAPEPAASTGDSDDETAQDELPLEPGVALLREGKGKEHTLPARAPGSERRMVAELRITEGAKKRLHLPLVRLVGDVVLDAIDDSGSRWRWTPRQSEVLVSGDGVDPEFLVRFEAALAPGEAPAAIPLVTDRWDVVTDLQWPAGEDPHAGRIGAALRVALGHLAIPVPSYAMKESTRWEVRRRVDLWGIPAWQTLTCTAKTIEGPQLEVNATVTYALAADEPIVGTPLGLASVAGLKGQGKLKARYDLPSATPIDMLLSGTLDIRPTVDAKPTRFGFELRVDEDYMARPDPRVKLTGELTQGGLVHGVVPPTTKVWFEKERVMVSPEGDFLFGFGRSASPRALLSFAFPGGPTERHVLHVTSREFEPEVIDGLPPEMVELDRETRKVLAKYRAKIAKVRKRASTVAYFRDGFTWPVKGRITSTYGRRRVLDGEDHDFHWGVDVAVPVGKKIKAPAAGVVVLVEADVPLSGNLLILDHGHGLTSSFLHLHKFKVKEGDVVKAGQVIATSGNSGRSTGPHLDWRMNLLDTRVDPQLVAGPMR